MAVVTILGFIHSSESTSGAVLALTLLDWTTVPIPSGAHADRYPLPNSLLAGTGKIITTVELDYTNLPNVSGDHPIQSAAFLFDPDDVSSVTVFVSTSQRYWARVVLNDPWLTSFTNPFAPAFVAMHGPIGGGTDTSAHWTVTYLDSTTASSNNGIIPEPASVALVAMSATAGFLRRRPNRTFSPY